jgi:6-phosphogluconolactonase
VGSPDAARVVAVHETLADASLAAAAEIAGAARDAVERSGRFVVALAGGETPRLLYELLSREHRERVPWDRTDVCFGDERCVPPNHPASSYGMVRDALLDHVPLPPGRAHRIVGELGPKAAARDYDARLHLLFSEDPDGPTFDVALLGVGTDGHTASLFPGDAALEEQERLAVPIVAPRGVKVRKRVTLTLAVLNRSRVVLVLCAGAQKRDVVARILSGAAPELPAARVYGVARTLWLLDRAAAA